MRTINYFVYGLLVAAFFGSLFLPNAVGWKLMCASLFAGGLWSSLFPSELVGWVRAAHHELDPRDRSLWWIARIIGAGLMALSLAMTLGFSR
jgi:hypothetical protein